MSKLLNGLMLFLMTSPLLAAVGTDESAANAPSETVDMMWVIVFAVVFFGMIAYFFWHLWRNEKKRTPEQ